MYDLPRRFNVGMMERRCAERPAAVDRASLPPWPENSGLKKQHSVEYWMMASLVAEDGGGEGEVVRVWDGDEAEAFFVPFFSSISFNAHGHNMMDPDTEIDRQLQVMNLEKNPIKMVSEPCLEQFPSSSTSSEDLQMLQKFLLQFKTDAQ